MPYGCVISLVVRLNAEEVPDMVRHLFLGGCLAALAFGVLNPEQSIEH